MSPNDALFDAINRGDLATVRDAMNRGALLNARNILGMTPLELSVDLSRNDITFYLLSLRGADTPAPPPPAVVAAAKPPLAAAKAARVEAKARPVAVQRPQPAAPQYAGGGTPDPAAGFLGFGGTTQVQ
jgi:hypothetical protein